MILNGDCFEFIKDIESKSVSLIITDPPYLISRNSNFRKQAKNTKKELLIKYDISIDFGDWDKIEMDWDFLFKEYKRILKDGGTLIIFYDIWKSKDIKELADKYKFKQPRVCQWQKSNPVPINSKINYLSNSIEYFFTFTKGKNPTFNSVYDNGVYVYPICHGKERFDHPTQKPLSLISDLVIKHSNPGDLVLDNFAGTGTTGHACLLNNRDFILIEKDINYFNILQARINNINNNLIYK